MSPSIRTAEPADWPAIAELTVAAYLADGLVPVGHPYLDRLRDTGDRVRHARVLVAVDATGVVLGSVTYCRPGTVYAELSGPGESEFRMLAVDPAHRGLGAGKALVRACLEHARAAGDAAVVLSTLDVTASARQLYGRLGFVAVPERDWSPDRGIWLRAYRCDLSG